MKKVVLWLAAALVAMWVSQCSQLTEPEPQNDELTMTESIAEIESSAAEIDAADEVMLTDSTEWPRVLERAFHHLDKLLERTHALVDTAGNATADSLLSEADADAVLAEEAAGQDSLRLAMSYIRSSRHLALEAVRVIKGEAGPPEYLEHLWADLDTALALAEKVHDRLEGVTAPVARRLYHRGMDHLRLAREALEHRKPRKAHIELHLARDFFKRALARLS